MESIKSAFHSLKIGVTKSKNKDVDIALDKLAAVLDILKLDTYSGETLLSLSDLLRHAIQPLYEHELPLTLNFSSAVLLGLYYAKVIVAEDAVARKSWEAIQCSLLSGLLDYLDGHRTGKPKSEVGQAFYSPICRLYFSTAVNERINANSTLLSTVFMLLSEIVCGQATNGLAFRRELVGGRRLGFTIHNIKDFLPLEAALELIANLLLGFKGASREKAKFIQEVFSPQIFSDSSKFVEILSKVTTSQRWTQASPEVIKLIASQDVSFPQPFPITNFQLKGLKSKNLDNIYIESASFLANIPISNGFDTLIIPFSTVTKITLTSLAQQVSIVLALSSPPNDGFNPVECAQKDITVGWKIEKAVLSRFLTSLRSRKLAPDTSKLNHSRKLSVAEIGITLDASSEGVPPKATQDKAIAVAKLWDGSESTSRGAVADCNPTSPLLHSIFPPNSEDVKDKSAAFPEEPAQTVFIDDEGNLADKPTQAIRPKATTSAARMETRATSKPEDPSHDLLFNKALNVLLSASRSTQEERDAAQPRPPARRKSHFIVLDSDESELTDEDQFDIPSPTPTRRDSLRNGSSAPKGAVVKGKEPTVNTERLGGKKAAEPVMVMSNKPALNPKQGKAGPQAPVVLPKPKAPPHAKELKRVEPEHLVPPTPHPTTKKRPAPELTPDDGPPLPPSKRPRTAPDDIVSRPRPTTRYRSKLRGSSPTAAINVDISDDDEPPKAPKPIVRKDSPKRKRAAMKDKSGKTKPVPVLRRKVETNVTNKQSTPAFEVKDVKPNIGSITGSKNAIDKRSKFQFTAKKEPQSVKLEATTPHIVKTITEPKPAAVKSTSKKPQKALWQRDSFMANAQKMSTPARDMPSGESEPDPIEWGDVVAPEGAFQFGYEEEEPQDVISISGESGGSETFVTEPPLKEYWLPIKGSVESLPEEDVLVKEDVVMIDLTISPKTLKPAPSKVVKQKAATILREPKRDVRPAPPVVVKEKEKVVIALQDPKQEIRPAAANPSKSAKPKVEETKKLEKLVPQKPLSTTAESVPEPYDYRVPHLKVRPWSEPERPQNASKTSSPETMYDRIFNDDRNTRQTRINEATESLPEVLQLINKVLLDKVQRRFDGARQGMSQAQLEILGGAADALKPMYDEAAEHFNAMVDLEEEYASHRRMIMTAMDTFRTSANQAAASVKQVTQNHARQGLAKKFPTKLFTKPLPTVKLNF